MLSDVVRTSEKSPEATGLAITWASESEFFLPDFNSTGSEVNKGESENLPPEQST